MKCLICRNGETRPGHVTVTLERAGAMLVFRSVPSAVCENCGEQYFDAQTTRALLDQAERAAQAGVEVEVRSYVAA
jgi:YgiT-type zinc finger domain-containing protein